MPVSIDQGLGLLVWSPLAGGLLSGKYRRGEPGPEQSRLLSGWDELPVLDQDKLYDIVEVLVEVAKDRQVAGAGGAGLAAGPAGGNLGDHRRLHLTEQLADNLGAADLSLTTEELTRLEEVSRPPLLYPYWHQAKTAADFRLGLADLSLLGSHLA